jgi:hypothetical protein
MLLVALTTFTRHVAVQNSDNFFEKIMIFLTLFHVALVAVFFITLFFALVPNKLIGWLLLGMDVVIWLVTLKWYFDYLNSSAYDFHVPNFGLLLAIASFLALVLARPLTKLRAGKLILRLRQSNTMDNVSLIFVPVFFCGAIYALLPREYQVSDHSPILDAQYFNSNGILFLFMLVMGLNFLSTGLQRPEFRRRGYVHNNGLWKWDEFESHQWNEISSKPSELELLMKIKPKRIFLKQIKLTVAQSDRQIIDELLVKDQI